MAYEDLWKSILADIELQISRAGFVTWFKQTSIVEMKDGEVIIGVPNGFAKEWLQNKYHKAILHAFRNSSNTIKNVNYVIIKPPSEEGLEPSAPLKKKKESPDSVMKEAQSELRESRIDPETNLNPRYTFSNFIVGSFNEIAHASVQSALQTFGKTCEPIFVYGGVGLGKTHLIQAFGNEIIARYPEAKVKYITSEKFMGELLDAYQLPQKMDALKARYRTIDVFIVDDIQFLGKTEKMQEDFFHTFNSLYEKNKQIIISSDRHPKAIPTLEERLRSRFEGGFVCDITVPDFETRVLILKMKAQEKKFLVPDDVIDYIAHSVKTNIRELEGALNRLIINAKISNTPLAVEEVKKVLASSGNVKKFTTPKKIIKAVAEFYDIKEQELINQSRKQHFVKPRQIVMYLLRTELSSSFPSIGEYLGGRDHSTVIHACEKISEELKHNLNLEEELRNIKDKIYKL